MLNQENNAPNRFISLPKMPPKKGGKKGKKNLDDEWVEPISKQSVPNQETLDGTLSHDSIDNQHFKNGKHGGFHALLDPELPAFNQDDHGEDLGGLMGMLGKSKGKKNKKKKNARNDDDEEDALAILARLDQQDAEEKEALHSANKKESKKNLGDHDKDHDDSFIESKVDSVGEEERVGMDDTEENEKPTVQEVKKGKKGKAKSKKNDFDDEEDAAAILARLDEEEAVAKEKQDSHSTTDIKVKKNANGSAEKENDENEAVAPEPGTIHIKSKKEKERERKERAKLAKKKQAPKKSGLEDTSITQPEPVVEEPVENTSGKGKKKGKAPSAAILAIREAMAAQKAAEEKAAREAEEEEQRLAEIAAREAEAERQKEEIRRLKKEKEKAKKEELKKAGLYLTPAQKAAQAQQKAKLEAMLAAGVVVPALTQENESDQQQKRKRPVYSNKKKKSSQNQNQSSLPPPPDTAKVLVPPPTKPKNVSSVKSVEPVLLKNNQDDEVKDSWDASSEDDQSKEEKVKESWDASSDEEEIDEVKDSWDQESVEELIPEKSKVGKTDGDKTGATQKAQLSKQQQIQVQKKQEKNEEEEEEEESDNEEEESSDEEEDDSESDDEELTVAEKQELKRKEEAAARRQTRIAASYAARSKDNLRSPICCILGHVDTGKTKLLDKIRQTNVQEGEAGGITQQIGATYFPLSAIEEKTEMIHKGEPSGYQLPGLLVIDTPGHESFTNLRSRGSSLCNIAVLVVDIVHGLEPQTIESLNLLRQRKTPFIVALNKIDRLFDWTTHANYPTRETLSLQKKSVIGEFNDRVTKTIVEFAEQGLNACLYWENKNLGKNVSLVPTSAITGEGVPDLLHLLMDLTQSRMTEKLMYLSELECTVLEVKVIEGLGTTIDVVLSNGVLNEGDRICVCGLNGPIVTNVRALLTPQPMRELRVKSAYQHHKTVKASLGIKIAAPDLEKAIAGSRLLLIGPDDDEEEIMEEVMGDLTNLLTSIDKSGKGVCVQASTLGSLEALLSFLKDSKIPVSGINIGPVHKKDIIRASVMLERAKEYAQLLAFDVPIDKDAEQLATDMGVKIFSANIIYHLFDKFTAYMKELEEQKRKDAMPTAVFPCVIRMVPDAIFNKRSPVIIGVDVLEGVLKIGTPLCVVNKESGQTIDLGKVVGIELNHKARTEVKKGDPSVAIRIESPNYATPATYGRHFTQDDDIYSKISRESIDVLKTTFRNEMSKDDWALVIKLKKVLSIQ